ncbi:MAG: hypothetical protein HW384_177 [Dehalococcoidia bacterium]|nr:hypothetical protein [Dehalococcoidia bacterium]
MKRLNWQNNIKHFIELLHKATSQGGWYNLKVPVFLMLAVAFIFSSCQATVPPASTRTTPQPTVSPVPAIAPTPPQSDAPSINAQAVPTNRDKPVIIEFAKAINALNKDWEGYRRTYGDWRQKGVCVEPAMTESLNKFVANFQKVKRTASELPQSSVVRSVAERLAEAAEKEEAALIDLRANWKPGDESIFQKYETNKLAADRIRRQAEQNLNDLISATQVENIESIDKYRKGRTSVEVEWDTLQKDYKNWRQSLPADNKIRDTDKEKTAMTTLQKIADASQSILNKVYALPPPTLARKSADLFVEAAEKEEAALRKLKASWKPGDEESITNYEREQLTVNKLRRDSTLLLESMASVSLQGNRPLLQQFSTSYGQVSKAWDDVLSQYDDWRNKGGDCDRNAVRQQLLERLNTFSALAQRVNALPQPTIVRPLAELMTQAAEKEETTLRQLRDNWKPYDSGYYQNYEKEWVAIDRLRRQAAAGLTDLVQKNNISPSDIGQ